MNAIDFWNSNLVCGVHFVVKKLTLQTFVINSFNEFSFETRLLSTGQQRWVNSVHVNSVKKKKLKVKKMVFIFT